MGGGVRGGIPAGAEAAGGADRGRPGEDGDVAVPVGAEVRVDAGRPADPRQQLLELVAEPHLSPEGLVQGRHPVAEDVAGGRTDQVAARGEGAQQLVDGGQAAAQPAGEGLGGDGPGGGGDGVQDVQGAVHGLRHGGRAPCAVESWLREVPVYGREFPGVRLRWG